MWGLGWAAGCGCGVGGCLDVGVFGGGWGVGVGVGGLGGRVGGWVGGWAGVGGRLGWGGWAVGLGWVGGWAGVGGRVTGMCEGVGVGVAGGSHLNLWGVTSMCTIWLSVPEYFWFCKCTTPWMFPPLNILLEYWIEYVTFGLLYVIFTFPTRIFYRGVPGFATDRPCGVWCRGLTTCLLYVGPLFGNLVWMIVGLQVWHKGKQLFCCFWLFYILMSYNIILYFRLPIFMSQIVLYLLHSTSVLSFYIDVEIA